MPKPIFLVGLPMSFSENVANIQESLEQKFEDYYTLVYIRSEGNEIDFKAVYEKDFDEVKFEELKELVRSNTR